MTPFYDSSSRLRCEIKVVRLRNFDSELLSGNLFVRYYVYAGSGRRIRVDTRDAPAAGRNNPCWDQELASFECMGGVSGPVRELLEPRGKGVAFELRWRSRKTSAPTVPSFLGSLVTRSKLLARSEVVAWEDVVAASSAGKAPLERWIPLAAKDGAFRGLKLPSLLVEMKVEMAKAAPGEGMRTQRRAPSMEKGCDCRDCEWAASEEDMFQAAAICSAW